MVRILADSTCDLGKALAEEYEVSILPLHIILGEKEYEDGTGISPEEIYRWSDDTGQGPRTSAPSMQHTAEMMKGLLETADELLCFAISESMSASANVMRLAAEEIGAENRVIVIDSANLSTGIGHLVLEAAILAREGKTGREIADRIERLKPLVRASFVVDTLTFLHRGGRCGGLAAMAGGVLHLHPRIEVKHGEMGPGKKYRGRIEKVIMDYVRDMEPELKRAASARVFITHSGVEQEVVEQVQDYLESLEHFQRVLVTRAGGVVSSHCGPGTLGVLFLAGEQE